MNPIWLGGNRIELTDWYQGSQEPVRDGVYIREIVSGMMSFARWSDGKWHTACRNAGLAELCMEESNLPWARWRGLVQPYLGEDKRLGCIGELWQR